MDIRGQDLRDGQGRFLTGITPPKGHPDPQRRGRQTPDRKAGNPFLSPSRLLCKIRRSHLAVYPIRVAVPLGPGLMNHRPEDDRLSGLSPLDSEILHD